MRLLLVPKRSIHAKLVLFFLIVAIIPLIILGTMSYFKSAEAVHSQFSDYGQYIVTQLQFQIDASLSQMRYIAYDINSYLSDPTLIVVREEVPKSYSGFLEQKNFERYLDAHRTLDTKGIFVITKSGYFYGKNAININQLKQEPWWKALPPKLEGEHWLGFYTPRHYLRRSESRPRDEKVLGLLVPVLSQYGVMKDSRILIEMDAQKLFHLFSLLEKDMSSHIRISEADRSILYETNGEFHAKPTDIVWTRRMESNNWTIEVRMPYDQFYRSSDVIRSSTVIAMAGSLVLVLALAYLFSRRITQRIRRLEESMHLVGTGALQTRTRIDSEDEIGRLGLSFNHMVKQIHSLVTEVGRTEQLKKEAELRAFHYQINPHLLFNTLNSIQWKARLQGADDIRLMLYHLIKVLEGNLDFTHELVPLEKELQTVEHFLHIQEIRYGPVFRFQLDSDPALHSFLIPRMSLQPLLENIFFHAFEDGQGTIRLGVTSEGDNIVLTLSDDGAGITPERLVGLLDPSAQRRGKRGLGVCNVDQKFKLHFGAEYGLEIHSVSGEGTVIQMRWPKREGESGEY